MTMLTWTQKSESDAPGKDTGPRSTTRHTVLVLAWLEKTITVIPKLKRGVRLFRCRYFHDRDREDRDVEAVKKRESRSPPSAGRLLQAAKLLSCCASFLVRGPPTRKRVRSHRCEEQWRFWGTLGEQSRAGLSLG